MTTDALRIRKGTLARKLKEQASAKEKGSHQRWLHTRDRPGAGITTRLVCDKAAGGELHLLSEAEHAEFLEGWYRRDVKVIYDQVALDRDKTRRAAASINVAHPFYRHLDEPSVFSTALVYLTGQGVTLNREARSIRSTRSGKNGELTRSQLIEKKAWEDDGVSYFVVKANGMHARRSKNLAWIFRAHNDTIGRDLSDVEMGAQRELLRLFRLRKEMRVIDACGLADRTLHLSVGSGVRAFRQLAGARQLTFDLDVSDPLELRVAEISRSRR
ncbi:TnsA endonuclease C-terminal domain-containing protein [Paraburkholderia sabiae]|uniref:TnsA endonuclease C-terminal domain-containing protein n=1 Tax=Paraburkholderia sabiae TaxID=273251 RepID=A0ABU9QKE6_9BURK|nr:TnsA endonuclease C-terminal domain-containing protein [Paraburkholderia sabiae]WJZ76464.1 TnsA endonuclease C-terminal domain-containing protein [Paraburkholderia sabiae]CAD6560129.1 Transposon Tn7 transposition protein TnsA [Paraburkholderia sabiae]